MLPFLRGDGGNASSMHSAGRDARNAVDTARTQVAAAIGAQGREIVLTSGGTEADNLAIRGTLDRHRDRGRHVITTAVEHEAVLETLALLGELGRADVTVIECDGAGRVDAGEVADAVRDDTVLVSVMLANNEVASVQDVADIVRLVKARNAATLVHTDAVQAMGRIPVDVNDLGVDLLSLSAHKIYGPQGVGALFVRHGTHLAPQMSGGGQERGRRSGTENVAAVVGFGVAAGIAAARRDADMAQQRALVRRLADTVIAALPDIVLTGSALHRLPNIASFAIPGAVSEVIVASLDGEGICASGGSACSSGAAVASHVLAAMGIAPNVAQGALRISVGRATSEADIDAVAVAVVTAVLQARMPAGA